MTPPLRIIIDEKKPARFNMNADLWLLDQAAKQNTAFLRLYDWEQPSITLGCAQKAELVLDSARCAQDRVISISRPTGGRAVLHWNDLTYSFAFPATNKIFGSSIAESYAIIGKCLAFGLKLAGIITETHDSALDEGENNRNLKLPCFLAPNRDEIMVQGRKLIGSAQKRVHGAVLQHGSIPIGPEFRRLPEYLLINDQEKLRQKKLLREKCFCINEIKPEMAPKELSKFLLIGFIDFLKIPFFEKSWEAFELCQIEA